MLALNAPRSAYGESADPEAHEASRVLSNLESVAQDPGGRWGLTASPQIPEPTDPPTRNEAPVVSLPVYGSLPLTLASPLPPQQPQPVILSPLSLCRLPAVVLPAAAHPGHQRCVQQHGQGPPGSHAGQESLPQLHEARHSQECQLES